METIFLAVDTKILADIAPFFLVGIAVAGTLLVLFFWGKIVRSREPEPPAPETQPHIPKKGPVREIREYRELDEVPRTMDGSRRLMPYALRTSGGSKRAKHRRPRKWDEGHSGGFGSGSLGG
ncbi:hypothetical protein GCM10020367_57350 [Streptomyces sannanensis]|uniref:Secreted protein n=1 Tax=Streptomyces sannanensis TaxID=285536 RepID=A0ABP6SJK8_9ACTN